jgi:hypothetical protein
VAVGNAKAVFQDESEGGSAGLGYVQKQDHESAVSDAR